MNDKEKKEFEELKKNVKDFEERYKDHHHTGVDSVKVNAFDLYSVLHKEITINPGNLADGAGETQSVTVAGANLGDFVLVSASYDLQDVTVTGYVQAQDVVEIRIQNESGGARDLASGTWRIVVLKKLL